MKYDWNKLEVGQSVYLVKPNGRGLSIYKRYVRVDKVGRCYFHADGKKFSLITGRQVGQVSIMLAAQCYPTKTAFEQSMKAAALRDEVRHFIKNEPLPDELVIELGDIIRRYKREHGYAT